MAVDLGKKWEEVFKEDWEKTFPRSLIYRLKDQMDGFKETSKNPSDYICFTGTKYSFFIECKEHKGASIPFSAIPQYERLLDYKNETYEGIKAGVVIWFSQKKTVIWAPIEELEKLYNNGEKSVGIRHLKDPNYDFKVVPTRPDTRKTVYPDCDYSFLIR